MIAHNASDARPGQRFWPSAASRRLSSADLSEASYCLRDDASEKRVMSAPEQDGVGTRATQVTEVSLGDERGDLFVTDVPNESALTAYNHPHAYRPRGGVVTTVSRL